MRLTRAREILLRAQDDQLVAAEVDVALIEGPLGGVLSHAVERPVHGLLGYSFLRRFRTIVDYPHRVLWMEPIGVERDARPYEYSSIGVQLRRSGNQMVVDAVVEASPASEAGIAPGDVLIRVDGRAMHSARLIGAAKALEGPPGSSVRVDWRRGHRGRTTRLVRRQLL